MGIATLAPASTSAETENPAAQPGLQNESQSNGGSVADPRRPSPHLRPHRDVLSVPVPHPPSSLTSLCPGRPRAGGWNKARLRPSGARVCDARPPPSGLAPPTPTPHPQSGWAPVAQFLCSVLTAGPSGPCERSWTPPEWLGPADSPEILMTLPFKYGISGPAHTCWCPICGSARSQGDPDSDSCARATPDARNPLCPRQVLQTFERKSPTKQSKSIALQVETCQHAGRGPWHVSEGAPAVWQPHQLKRMVNRGVGTHRGHTAGRSGEQKCY
ncbi:retinoic acid receptor RXR-beta-like [Hyaena hyaena]|uniref:retinoic acid receptor RXR-beta-like n=1 Tax=Hyaena hyaena TaxID=95912 RepID=UPI0019244807|nr:retinoic acid receptor RXR-beta-like [Hyaena hyaena]